MAKAIKLSFLCHISRIVLSVRRKESNSPEQEAWGVFWFGLAPTNQPTAGAGPPAALPVVDRHV